MAVTCSWENPLGITFYKTDENREHPLFICGGGNCLAVIVDESKGLHGFIADKEHFKALRETLEVTFHGFEIFTSRKKESKVFINLLLTTDIDFSVTQSHFISKI